jgi:hypothetical protein
MLERALSAVLAYHHCRPCRADNANANTNTNTLAIRLPIVRLRSQISV